MLKFGVIAEGPTDQVVVENILLGYFQNEEEEPVINPVQPPRPLTETPAGWGHVFKSLKRRDYEGALQYNDFLIIHIDTDVQEDPGFDVPRREGGSALPLEDRVARVVARLRKDIDAAFYQANANRILFAVAVDSIECWLLPLLYRDKKKAAKTTGCLESANQALRKADEDALSAGENKFIRAYEKASRGYRKRKTLLELRGRNPSLELFLKQLDDLQSGSTEDHPADSQGRGNAATEIEKPTGRNGGDQPG